jgi:23S rRNA (adenine2030-N6)-methyltransferase
MNYRHAFHAGNFADVLKHAVLAQILLHLKQKPAAFRVLDVHAGVGVYRLYGDEAERTGEWLDGIGRLLGPDAVQRWGQPKGALADLVGPYLDVVRDFHRAQGRDADRDGASLYPGSVGCK